VELWNNVVDKIHRSYQTLTEAAISRADRKSLRLTRLVLDVEMGGILYAAVADFGWVFAATLNQQAMNHGQAEESLSRIVHGLLGVLGHRNQTGAKDTS
jgi:hypothetical protein